MRPAPKLVLFALLLALVLGGSVAVGGAVDPIGLSNGEDGSEPGTEHVEEPRR